jgi:hypothetical protein
MSKAKIMIDPGHGPGCVNGGPTGYLEHEGMWKLSGYLKTALERCGCEVALTRAESERPELTERGNKAEGYDLFISEHSNAGGGRGAEAYYSVRQPENQGMAAELAEAASAVLGSPGRGAKTKRSTNDPSYDYYTVIGYAVAAGCPKVFICENGFHDNAHDEAVLKQDGKLQEMAEAQAKVICAHLGVAYVGADTPAPEPGPGGFAVGDAVRVRPGAEYFATGQHMASWVRESVLYVIQVGNGKVLVSTAPGGAATGWIRTEDLVAEDGGSTPETPAPEAPDPEPAPTPVPSGFSAGDAVRVRPGAEYFATGQHMASFVRQGVLYVLQVGSGKALVSTAPGGAATGWIRTEDLVKA